MNKEQWLIFIKLTNDVINHIIYNNCLGQIQDKKLLYKCEEILVTTFFFYPRVDESRFINKNASSEEMVKDYNITWHEKTNFV